MAQIVKLSEYRKAVTARRPGASTTAQQQVAHGAPQGAPHYFCLRCDTDQFKLYPGGSVHCGHCGALMRNITITDKEPS
jgi:hypothetical protein